MKGGHGTNLQSASEQPEVIDKYLAEECSHGRVLGPLRRELFPQVHPNRFGVISKSSAGERQLIVDMLSPKEVSVNDGIKVAMCSLSYGLPKQQNNT